jgi:diguanylate cyclase (GGDEF)-like protein
MPDGCDRLTGVWSRQHFEEIIAREITCSEICLKPLSLAIFDFDRLAAVNHRHGRVVGDNVLRLTAVRLRGACRSTDLLFRWGGDQFALLAATTCGVDALAIVQRLRERVSADEMPLAGTLTVSAGVAEHRAGEATARWLDRVDAALRASKLAGRNRVTLACDATELPAWLAQARRRNPNRPAALGAASVQSDNPTVARRPWAAP